MPSKLLTSPFDGRGNPFKFGGGANDITAQNHDGTGYIIDSGGGDDSIVVLDIADAPGSDDILIGGNGSDFIIGGLGDDQIFGGNQDGTDGGKGKDGVAVNTLYGDARGSSGTFVGGNDVITGGNDSTNVMFGDVQSVGGTFTGGDDILIGGDNAVSQIGIAGTVFTAGNLMIGDGFSGSPTTAEGGDDTLVSGQNSDDAMIGDFGTGIGVGGQDTFVFGTSNGNDTIADFRSADFDMINLFDTGLSSFGDLSGHISIDGTDTVIDLGQAIEGTAAAGVDTITVLGVINLADTDFEFVDWMTA